MTRKQRTEFYTTACLMGLPAGIAKDVTALAATHDRLAEAECNGNYPCDNGERLVILCGRCGAGYIRERTYKAPEGRICQSCWVEGRISAIVADFPTVSVKFQGDPRGWTVQLSRREAETGVL